MGFPQLLPAVGDSAGCLVERTAGAAAGLRGAAHVALPSPHLSVFVEWILMYWTENVKVQFVIVAQIVVGQEETWLATFKTCFTFGSEAIKHAN